jgi:hypothetical protein
MHTHTHSKRLWIPESVSFLHSLYTVSLHMLKESSEKQPLCTLQFPSWSRYSVSGRPAALEASDFPELSGLLATSCSDQQSRLLFKSTVPRHGWPCDSRGITHHNPMPPGMQVPTLYFPPSKNAIATEGSGIPHTLERLVYFNCWHIIWWSMIHNFI